MIVQCVKYGDPALRKDRLISFATAQQFALSNKFRVTVINKINAQIWTASYGARMRITFCVNGARGQEFLVLLSVQKYVKNEQSKTNAKIIKICSTHSLTAKNGWSLRNSPT